MSAEPLHQAAVRTLAPWRAALYGRVSDDRNFGASTDEQDVDNTAVADAAGWPIAGRYSDAITASRFGTERRKVRGDFERLVTDIEAGRIDVVIVWEISRLTRDMEIGARLVKTCRRHRVRVHVTIAQRTYHLTRPTDVDDLHKAMAQAAHESEMTSVRVKRNKKSTARKGLPHGRVHYGYERLYDPHTRKLAQQRPHPDQAPVVVEIITRVGAGVPLSVLAADLNARGIPAPRGTVWLRSTVRRLAESPVYVGQRHYRYTDDDGQPVCEVLAGNWPALVSDLEHQNALTVLSDPARRTTRPGAARWLCSYLATCRCGAPLSVRAVRGVPTYVCSSAAQCSAIGVTRLDAAVTEVVCFKLSEPASFEALTAAGDDARLDAARLELKTLVNRRRDYAAAAAAGTIDPAFVGDVLAELDPAILAARKRAATIATPPALRIVLGAAPEPYEVIAARFADLSVAQRKAVVRALITVELHPALRSKNAPLDRRRLVIDPVTTFG